jgi:2'-5' RNA ligase
MRLFFAVELDEAARLALGRAATQARSAKALPHGLRWLPPESWHFTLQFLGEVGAARVPDLEAAAAATARTHAPFELVLATAGTFGSPRRARLIHVGASRGGEAMGALAATLHGRTAACGFSAEPRAFIPHLTMARLRQPGDVRAAIEALNAQLNAAPVTTQVRALALMRSHLSQQGARYERLHVAELDGR